MNLSLILFTIGILGFVLNRKNIILMLISIEIMLLAITFLILVSSLSFDDILGQTYAIYIIAIAGAESAIGLGILVAFYRLNPSLILPCGHTTYSKYINRFSSKRIVRCYSTMPNNNHKPGNCVIDP
jgi:NADH-ubiquinone oxidoreductase chain 4L